MLCVVPARELRELQNLRWKLRVDIDALEDRTDEDSSCLDQKKLQRDKLLLERARLDLEVVDLQLKIKAEENDKSSHSAVEEWRIKLQLAETKLELFVLNQQSDHHKDDKGIAELEAKIKELESEASRHI